MTQTSLTEREFQRQVLDVAVQYGWHIPAHDMRPWQDDPTYDLPGIAYHPLFSLGSERGWPDLTLIRVRRNARRIVWAELKSKRGVLSPRQSQVLTLLRHLAGTWVLSPGPFQPVERLTVEVHVWRPDDIDEIARVLA